MPDIEKIAALFLAQERLAAYNTRAKDRTEEQKELADINGDGKINFKDKSAITKEIKDLKKEIFTFDSDEDMEYDDLVFSEDGLDLDGDGTVSDAEKTFLTGIQKDLSKEISKEMKSLKHTGYGPDGKYYDAGKPANGIYEDLCFKNGELLTGIYKNEYYQEGVLFTGVTDKGMCYENGKKFTGIYQENGLKYKNGKAFSGTEDGVYYKNGEPLNGERKVTTYDRNGRPLSTTKYLYVDGKKLTGVNEEDGLFYKNGRLFTGTFEGIKYKKGVAQE